MSPRFSLRAAFYFVTWLTVSVALTSQLRERGAYLGMVLGGCSVAFVAWRRRSVRWSVLAASCFALLAVVLAVDVLTIARACGSIPFQLDVSVQEETTGTPVCNASISLTGIVCDREPRQFATTIFTDSKGAATSRVTLDWSDQYSELNIAGSRYRGDRYFWWGNMRVEADGYTPYQVHVTKALGKDKWTSKDPTAAIRVSLRPLVTSFTKLNGSQQ